MKHPTAPAPQRLAVTAAERERVERIDRLIALGQATTAELLPQLADPSWTVRRTVVAALGLLGDEAISALVTQLRDRRDDETLIAATVDALVASIGDVDRALAPLVDHADNAIVADVAQILGRRLRKQSVPLLAVLTGHADDNVAIAAIEALGRIGGRAAVEPLITAINSGNFFRVFPAIDVLGRSGDPRAVPPLAALLANRRYALEAARALGRTGDRHAVAPLAQMLTSASNTDVRVAALALADLVTRFRERFAIVEPIEDALRTAKLQATVARRLAQALGDAEPAERIAIAQVLGVMHEETAIAPLTRLLSDPAPGVANAAAEALHTLGRRFEPAVAEMLRTPDSSRRKLLLPLARATSSADDVARCLDDEDPDVRIAACEALARIGNPSAVGPLFLRLQDDNPAVVQSSVAAIQSLGGAETERLALEAARAEKPDLRRWGLRILAYFGSPAALDVCLAGLRDADSRVRDSAIYGLPFIDDVRARDALLETARNAVPRTRAAAVRALGECPGDARVQAALLRCLGDSDPWVRYYACQSLGRIGAEASVDSIVRLLTDEAGHVRVAAIEALSSFKSDVAQLALADAARADDQDVRRAALVGLGIERRPDSLPILAEAMTAPDTATRLVALAALAAFDDAIATEAIGRATHDPDEGVRNAAVGFLAGRRGSDATAMLIDLLRSYPALPRLHEALAMPSFERIRGLLVELEHADDEFAPLLTSALARMQRAEATAALVGALRLSHLPARKAAAMALAGLGTREALDALRDAAGRDPSPEVRQICAVVLS